MMSDDWAFFIWVAVVPLAFLGWLYYLRKKGEKMGLKPRKKLARQGRKTTQKKLRRHRNRFRKS